jgi:two-component system, LytTR family, sensor kinase
MRKLLLISLFIISARAYSQIDWSNYSTSFKTTEDGPSLGIAIPYNGIYDNFDKNVVGISHWNPQYKLYIDTTIDDQVPLYFVYDTAGVYFLVPHVNVKNARDFEFTVLLNNKTTIIPWSDISRFTQVSVGNMEAGSGITGNYRAGIGQYLVTHLRNRAGQIISSMVIYFREKAPEIRSLSTSDNALAFSNLVNKENQFDASRPDIGWHRQYTSEISGEKTRLKLSYNENNVLVDINSKIYKKDALEYALFKGDREIRKWGGNEYNNHYILLKDLAPGDYKILIRFRRQRNSVSELFFLVSSVWYKTATFRVAICAFLIFTVTFFIFFFKYRNQKQTLIILSKKAEQSDEELKNIHALLNPHFTFNALNSIQGLVNRGDVDAASKYLSSFGELLRETLKESKVDHIPITKELENLNIYISLEQLRYTFKYDLTVATDIDLLSSTIPPFLLQPFVENAIKHGLSKMTGKGELNINICKNENAMLITIADNGPGFNTGSLKEGYGLGLSRKRIELLNRDYGEELIELQIKSTGHGTSILLTFKNWL